MVISVVLWLASGDNWNTDKVMAFLPSLVSMMVACTSLFLAYFVLREQVRTRQAGTDPVVVVHLGSREDARILSTIEVSNVGAGAAQNVTVAFEAGVLEEYRASERVISKLPDRLHTIRLIKQNQSVSFNFGLGNELLKDPPPKPLNVSVEWFDIDGERYHSEQVIDPLELRFQRADDPLTARATKALEGIEKSLGRK